MRFRSRLEEAVDKLLTDLKIEYKYEGEKLPYSLPCSYTPDFKLRNGIYLEIKGYFSSADRRKTLAVLRDNPGIDLRMVFSNPNTKISKTSKTTYAGWCLKHGILYCASHLIPIQWLTSNPSPPPHLPTVGSMGTQTQMNSKKSTISSPAS